MRATAEPGFFRACRHSGTITKKLEQVACPVVDCTTMRTASVRHHRAFQYLLAVSRSESLRLTNWCLNKCKMP